MAEPLTEPDDAGADHLTPDDVAELLDRLLDDTEETSS